MTKQKTIKEEILEKCGKYFTENEITQDTQLKEIVEPVIDLTINNFASLLKDELTMINNCEEEISDEVSLRSNVAICKKIDELTGKKSVGGGE